MLKKQNLATIFGPLLALILIVQSNTQAQEEPAESRKKDIRDIAISSDGKYVVTSGADGFVRVWKTSCQKEIARYNIGHYGNRRVSIAISPDSRFIAAGVWDGAGAHYQNNGPSDHFTGSLRVIRLSNGKSVFKSNSAWVTAVAFSPNGKFLAWTGQKGKVGVVDFRTGQTKLSINMDSLPGTTIAFSPDGKLLASAVSDKLYIYQAATGKLLSSKYGIGATELNAQDMVFSPDSKSLAVGWGTGLRILDVATQKWITGRIRGPLGSYTLGVKVDYAQDGKFITFNGVIYDAKTFEVARHTHTGPSVFSPDGTHVWFGTKSGLADPIRVPY